MWNASHEWLTFSGLEQVDKIEGMYVRRRMSVKHD